MANSRLCSIETCDNHHYARGYCNAHYKRLRKSGDPLGGGTLRGKPLRWIDEVAVPYNSEDCLIWPYSKTRKGYGMVNNCGKMVRVHRYVCELVRGAPPTPEHEAAHSCGKGHEGCVAPGHLSWKTPKENQADRLEHGTHNRGERCGSAKLTEDAVRTILSLKGVETQVSLAERFGVAPSTIRSIHTGRNWAWLLAL